MAGAGAVAGAGAGAGAGATESQIRSGRNSRCANFVLWCPKNLGLHFFWAQDFTVSCKVLGRGFFRRAGSFPYISRQGMTSLDLCLQLIPSGQGNQPRCRQPALAGLGSPRYHRKGGGHWRWMALDGMFYVLSHVNWGSYIVDQ